MARKQPTPTIIKRLFALSGNICAFNNPVCSENMVDKKGNVIGRICHIEAANKKGERFNDNSNDEARRDFDNLILLCDKHHTITNDVNSYTVPVLQKMKADHEQNFLNNKFKVSEDTIADAIIKYEKNYSQINTNSSGVQVNLQGENLYPKIEIHNYPQNEKQELTVIDELFLYVLNQIKDGVGKDYKPEESINLHDKIVLNFKTKKEQIIVSEYIKSALLKTDLIRRRYEILDTESQKDIHSHIFGRYQELKLELSKNIEILNTLFHEFTPSTKKHDSAFINLAKAFVLFFFEDCTIFEKTKTEKAKQTKINF
ncbi:MAG: hypothetical protein FVQ77_00420 [Cytophagales bacterium]|nr:hypothetical protein [Cytophagales bacterium]